MKSNTKIVNRGIRGESILRLKDRCFEDSGIFFSSSGRPIMMNSVLEGLRRLDDIH